MVIVQATVVPGVAKCRQRTNRRLVRDGQLLAKRTRKNGAANGTSVRGRVPWTLPRVRFVFLHRPCRLPYAHQSPSLLSSPAEERLRIEPQPVRAGNHLSHRRHRICSSGRLRPLSSSTPTLMPVESHFPMDDGRIRYISWFCPIECKDIVHLASIPIRCPSCRTTHHIFTCRMKRIFVT